MCGWRDGGQRGDRFSLCTNALAQKMGWRGGRYIMLLHLQPYLNLVNPKHFSHLSCLLMSFPISQPLWFPFAVLSAPFVAPVFLPSPVWSCFFSHSASLSLFVLSFALLRFTSLTYLLSSFWQEQRFYYPTSPLPGWVRYRSGAVFTWHLM